MNKRAVPGTIAALIAMVGCCATQAQTLWDESTQGDLADVGSAPTALLASVGSNVVLGEMGNPGTGIDRDYFSIFVPVGSVLSAVTILPNTSVYGSASFLAMQVGSQITTTPTGEGVENLLGFVHYDSSYVGTDVLPLINPAGPLGSGTYSIWIQELDNPVQFGLDFVVTPVPLPGAALLLFSGLLGLTTFRRKRS